jgi:hypothetical protein
MAFLSQRSASLAGEAVGGVADAGAGFRAFRVGPLRRLEEAPALFDVSFAEQGAPHLEHYVEILLEPELEDSIEAGYRARRIAELEQYFSQACQRVLVLRLDHQGALECKPGPRVLLARQARVAHADVQLHGIGVHLEAPLQDLERLVELAFVVELVCAFVKLVRAPERFGHQGGAPGEVALL